MLHAYDITIEHNGRLAQWLRFAENMCKARDDAQATAQAEWPAEHAKVIRCERAAWGATS